MRAKRQYEIDRDKGGNIDCRSSNVERFVDVGVSRRCVDALEPVIHKVVFMAIEDGGWLEHLLIRHDDTHNISHNFNTIQQRHFLEPAGT